MPEIHAPRSTSSAAGRRRHALVSALAAGCVLAVLGCGQDEPSPTAPDPQPELATSATAALAFYQLTGGYARTCGITTDSRPYCWGDNSQGELGDGTTTDRAAPVAVVGGLRFRQISAGVTVTCGVTPEFRAYCWGPNDRGEVGDGTTTARLVPTPVGGGHLFRQLDTGFEHVCGVSYPDNRLYCWGWNRDGQIGNGTRTGTAPCYYAPCVILPVRVATDLTFRQVTAGHFHTCALSTDGRTFCWGLNSSGQVGDSSTVFRRTKPSRVARSLTFRQVDAGGNHTCAVTTDERAFCWGDGRLGQIGNGKAYLSFWPRAVAGGHSFRRVTAGAGHTCGETPSNGAYCWGYNFWGAVGDGTRTDRLTPVAVAGGLLFSQLSAGSSHTCGRTPADVGYCWGFNADGELGLGAPNFTPTLAPAPVVGPL
jgi:alpha-tubulin suppressor-like RCC1 family protein